MKIKKYIPYIYKDIKEYNELSDILQIEADNLEKEMLLAFNRQNVLTSDEAGIINYEAILDIKPLIEATLDERKRIVISRLTIGVPFTLNYLKQQLDSIIGVGLWNVRIDYDKYALYIQSQISNEVWYYELSLLVNRIKPAHIEYIFQPLVINTINISERIRQSYGRWRYVLDGTWKLGQTAFFEETQTTNNVIFGKYKFGSTTFKTIYYTEVKSAMTPSLQPAILEYTAENLFTEISKIVFNNNITIQRAQFISIIRVDNFVQIEIALTKEQVEKITNIKTYNSEGDLWASNDVNINIYETSILLFEYRCKEGV